MIDIKSFPLSSFIGRLLILNVVLLGISFNTLNAEEKETFPEIMKQVEKIVEIKKVVAEARKETTMIYHAIGRLILEFEAKYKWSIKKILCQLGKDLQAGFPEVTGLNSRSLQYMRKFAQEYPDEVLVKDVIAQLPWAHIESILSRVREKKHQLFYIKKAIEYSWSRNKLVACIQSALHKQEDLMPAATCEAKPADTCETKPEA